MMNKVISCFADSDVCYENLFSEATVALHSAAMRFDLEQCKVSFGLYARICVNHRLIDYLRREEFPPQLVDFDIDSLSCDDELEAEIVTRDTVNNLLSGAERMLSLYEYRVLMLHIQGYKSSAIAKEFDRTPKSVDNAKSRIFRRLRAEYGKSGES